MSALREFLSSRRMDEVSIRIWQTFDRYMKPDSSQIAEIARVADVIAQLDGKEKPIARHYAEAQQCAVRDSEIVGAVRGLKEAAQDMEPAYRGGGLSPIAKRARAILAEMGMESNPSPKFFFILGRDDARSGNQARTLSEFEQRYASQLAATPWATPNSLYRSYVSGAANGVQDIPAMGGSSAVKAIMDKARAAGLQMNPSFNMKPKFKVGDHVKRSGDVEGRTGKFRVVDARVHVGERRDFVSVIGVEGNFKGMSFTAAPEQLAHWAEKGEQIRMEFNPSCFKNPVDWYEMGYSVGTQDWKAKNVGLDTGDPNDVIRNWFTESISRAKAFDRITAKEEAKFKIQFSQGYWDGLVQKKTPKNRRRKNPESTAADVYEEFHGKPSESLIEIEFEEHEHEHLAGLGTLVQLKVVTPFKKEAELNAPDPERSPVEDHILLCCNEEKTQLYLVGGDQSLSNEFLEKLGFKKSKNDFKDWMVLGLIAEVTYRTEKHFDQFKVIDYYHELGEESGMVPLLVYDYRSGLMRIAGGQYEIKDVGIVN